jgi:ParB family chromosome partitioning protein
MNSNNEWYTPDYVLGLARAVLGHFDLDPASCAIAQDRVKANKFYTEKENGLLFPWEGKVWCNPPYSAALIKKFTAKFLAEYLVGNMQEGIMLTNSGTDTLWNVPLSKGVQAYTVGRISFLQPDGSEKGKGGRGQVFTYLGPKPDHFIDVFTRNDFCWVPNLSLKNSVAKS